jgi:hypothetical protein
MRIDRSVTSWVILAMVNTGAAIAQCTQGYAGDQTRPFFGNLQLNVGMTVTIYGDSKAQGSAGLQQTVTNAATAWADAAGLPQLPPYGTGGPLLSVASPAANQTVSGLIKPGGGGIYGLLWKTEGKRACHSAILCHSAAPASTESNQDARIPPIAPRRRVVQRGACRCWHGRASPRPHTSEGRKAAAAGPGSARPRLAATSPACARAVAGHRLLLPRCPSTTQLKQLGRQ